MNNAKLRKMIFFFFSSRRRHTRYWRDWSSDVCSSDLKARLRREGVPGEEIRERLEALNMGRLRIASKGIVRAAAPTDAADPFRRVDEGEQRREGMYMLGQVAALHRERTTIPELHARIGRGSAELLAEFAARPRIVPADER